MPAEADSLAAFLRHFSLLSDNDEGESESECWARSHVERLAVYFAADGWNARTRHAFADVTGYAPMKVPGSQLTPRGARCIDAL